jgi:hypothetical protein
MTLPRHGCIFPSYKFITRRLHSTFTHFISSNHFSTFRRRMSSRPMKYGFPAASWWVPATIPHIFSFSLVSELTITHRHSMDASAIYRRFGDERGRRSFAFTRNWRSILARCWKGRYHWVRSPSPSPFTSLTNTFQTCC